MRRRLTVLFAMAVALSLAGVGAAEAHKRPAKRRAPAQPPPETRVVFETPLLDPVNFRNEGVGMYADASTAGQLSTFTINKRMISCGVGATGDTATGTTGAFAMLMYSTKIDRYDVDAAGKTITGTGRMRSITRMGPSGSVAEDVEHDFVAVAVDKVAGQRGDRFDMHFRTPLWNTGSPMCTPSTIVAGGCRFGGDALMGDVTVS